MATVLKYTGENRRRKTGLSAFVLQGKKKRQRDFAPYLSRGEEKVVEEKERRRGKKPFLLAIRGRGFLFLRGRQFFKGENQKGGRVLCFPFDEGEGGGGGGGFCKRRRVLGERENCGVAVVRFP